MSTAFEKTPTVAEKMPSLPPGPRLPAAMQTARWLLGSTTFMDRCRDRFGDMFTLHLVAKATSGPAAKRSRGPLVFLADPELVRQVFTADPDVMRTGDTNRFLEPLVGPRSILVQDEPRHREQRKLMLPPLHGERVRDYGTLMSDVAEARLSRWPIGEPFSLWPHMQAITLEVIVRAVFGICDPHRVASVTAVLGGMLNRMTSPRWLFTQSVRAAVTQSTETPAAQRLIGPVDEIIHSEITERRAVKDLDRRDDILSLLLQARYSDGSTMTDEDLRDELMTLLVAGHESTATALAWALELLLRHPDKVSRLRDEAEAGRDDYAAAVAQETLRLRPVVPFVLRNLSAPMDLGDYLLPAGTWIAPCAYLINRREDVYPQPLVFSPERFLDRPPGAYTWLPFGGGVRRCLGASFAQLEMRRVLQTVLAQAELVPAQPKPEKIRARFITLAPQHGARVVMTRWRS